MHNTDMSNEPDNIKELEEELLLEVGVESVESGFGLLEPSQDELDDLASQLGCGNQFLSDDYGFDEENYDY